VLRSTHAQRGRVARHNPAVTVYGLIQLHGRSERGRAYTIFTDSTAAMRRITGDAPGPGQEMATRAIEIAERVVVRETPSR
jgi:hypothetical protein